MTEKIILPCLDKHSELNKIPDLHYKAINYVFEENLINENGLWLEFGVYVGGTINRIAKFTKNTIYGFDSFEGLPEHWPYRTDYTFSKGTFNLDGWMPQVDKNVVLIKGWFNEVLSSFKKDHPNPITFIHIDSDIYSSCKEILYSLVSQITHDCVIVFDEMVNYPGFEYNEWKAWWEFVQEYNISFEWIGGNQSKIKHLRNPIKKFEIDNPAEINVSPSWENVALKVTNNPHFKL